MNTRLLLTDKRIFCPREGDANLCPLIRSATWKSAEPTWMSFSSCVQQNKRSGEERAGENCFVCWCVPSNRQQASTPSAPANGAATCTCCHPKHLHGRETAQKERYRYRCISRCGHPKIQANQAPMRAFGGRSARPRLSEREVKWTDPQLLFPMGVNFRARLVACFLG